MTFTLTEEQVELASAVTEFFEKWSPETEVRRLMGRQGGHHHLESRRQPVCAVCPRNRIAENMAFGCGARISWTRPQQGLTVGSSDPAVGHIRRKT